MAAILNKYTRKALALGRISLVRSLGREGIPVTVVREGGEVFERASRYCREFLRVPSLVTRQQEALDILQEYGRCQDEKPVAFFNGESDVMLFSANRDHLSDHFEIVLSPHELLESLVDKGKFARLCEEFDLPVPRTVVPRSREEYLDAAGNIGFPCVLKPVSQRLWHSAEVLKAIGLRKAMLIPDAESLERVLNLLPPACGRDMIQQYIPGDDQQNYDCHMYIDRQGNLRGELLEHKLRTYPIHFGQGTYIHYSDDSRILRLCRETLKKIGYRGAADLNLKRDTKTGRVYLLEINPRFSLCTVIDTVCGVNLPLLQYLEGCGLPVPRLKAHGAPRRWLWFGSDVKAMRDYCRRRELTFGGWLHSFFSYSGKVEFHIFAWDDPLPLLVSCWQSVLNFIERGFRYLRRRLLQTSG